MLGDITAADEIYIVTGRTDMRKSIDGLCAIREDQPYGSTRSALYLSVENVVTGSKLCSGSLTDLSLLYKRMEVQGRFRWPRNQLEVKQLTWQKNSTGSCPVLKSNNQKHSNLRNDRVKPLCQPTKMESFPHPVSCLQSLVNTGFSASFSLLFMV